MPLSLLAWEPPKKMPAYTCLPAAVLAELVSTPGMAAACQGHDMATLPVSKWPRGAVNVLAREMAVIGETGLSRLLEVDAESSGTVVASSTVPGGGLGVFATRDIAAGTTILPFFGQLVYHDLQVAARSTGARLSTRLYGSRALPGFLTITASDWLDNALQLRTHSSLWQPATSASAVSMVPTAVGSELGMSAEEWPFPVWVMPADFCAGGKANDPRPSFVSNANFEQLHDPVYRVKDIVLAGCGVLRVTTDIKPGQEVFVTYGRGHRVGRGRG